MPIVRADEMFGISPGNVTGKNKKTGPKNTYIGPSNFIRADYLMKLNKVDIAEDDVRSLVDILGPSPEQIEDWGKLGKIGYFEMARRTSMTESVTDLAPFVGSASSVYRDVKVMQAMDRVRDNEYGTKYPMEQRNKDALTVEKKLQDIAELEVRGLTTGAKIYEGFRQQPAFLAEFVLSGGIQNLFVEGSKKVIHKKLRKSLEKSLAGRITKGIGESTVRGAAFSTFQAPHRGTEGYVGRELGRQYEMTKKGLRITEKAVTEPFKSFAYTAGDLFAEGFSEVSGGLILNRMAKPFGDVGLAIIKKYVGGMVQLFKRMRPTESVRKLFTKTGYNGFITELGEERVGDLLRAVMGIEDFGVDEGNVLDRVLASFSDPETYLVEMGVIGLTAGSNTAVRLSFNDKVEEEDKRIEVSKMAVLLEKEVEDITEGGGVKLRDLLSSKEGGNSIDAISLAVEEALNPIPKVDVDPSKVDSGWTYLKKPSDVKEKRSERSPVTLSKEVEVSNADAVAKADLILKGKRAFYGSLVKSLQKQVRKLTGITKKLSASTSKQNDNTTRKIDSLNAKIVKAQKELNRVEGLESDTAIKKTKEKLKNTVKNSTDMLKDAERLLKRQEKEGQKNIDRQVKEIMGLSESLLLAYVELSSVEQKTIEELEKGGIELTVKQLEAFRKRAVNTGTKNERARLTKLFKDKNVADKERRKALVSYLNAKLPGKQFAHLRSRYMTRIANGLTENKLQEFFKDIDSIRENEVSEYLNKELDKLTEKIKAKIGKDKVRRGNFGNSELGVYIQRKADYIRKVIDMTQDDVKEEISELTKKVIDFTLDKDSRVTQEEFDANALQLSLINNLGGYNEADVEKKRRIVAELNKEVEGLLNTGSWVKEFERAQRNVLIEGVISEIEEPNFEKEGIVGTLVENIKKHIKYNAGNFTIDNLQLLWDKLDRSKTSTFIKPLIIEPLRNLHRNTEAIKIYMGRTKLDAVDEFFGIPSNNKKEYVKWYTNNLDNKKGFVSLGVELNNGTIQDLEFNRDEIMYWYALAHTKKGVEDAEAMESLTGENALAGVIEEYTKLDAVKELGIEEEEGKKQKLSRIKGNAIPKAVLNEMFDTLSKEEKDFAMRIREGFTEFYPIINKVFSRIVGVDLTNIKSYIPRLRKNSRLEAEDIFEPFSVMQNEIGNPGYLKERNPKSFQAFKQIGLVEVFDNFTDTMAPFIAGRELMIRMKGIINDPTFKKKVILLTGGKIDKNGVVKKASSYYEALRFHVNNVANRGSNSVSARNSFVSALRRNITPSMLAEVKQWGLQITSFAVALERVPVKDFIKGLHEAVFNFSDVKKLLNKSPIIPSRYSNMMQEMQEVIYQSNQASQGKPGKTKRQIFNDAMFYFVREGNKIGSFLGGYVIFKHTYEKTNGDVGAAYKSFDRFVTETQQASIPEQVAQIQTSNWRHIWYFISAPIQYSRGYVQAFNDLARGRINVKQFARKTAVYHAVVPILRWVLQAFLSGGADEEELITNVIKGPFNGLPGYDEGIGVAAFLAYAARKSFMDEEIESKRFFSSASPSIVMVDRVRREVEKAVREGLEYGFDEETMFEAVLPAVRTTGALSLGLPSSITEVIHAVYLQSTDEFNFFDLLGVAYGHSVGGIRYNKKREENQ